MKIGATLLSALVAAGSYADPVQISVTGTATSTKMGYTSGQSYTFNWIVNDGYTGGSGDAFISGGNLWEAQLTTDPLLWTSVYGDGLSGTYSRPIGTSTAPYESLHHDAAGLDIVSGNDDPSGSFTGLTVDGTEVRNVDAYNLDIPGLDDSATAFLNPASWLAAYTNTYILSSGFIRVLDESSNLVTFTPTSATIQAIPEPSSIALVGLMAGSMWAVRRFFSM